MNFLNTLHEKFSRRTRLTVEIIAVAVVLAIAGFFVVDNITYKASIIHYEDRHIYGDQLKGRQAGIDQIRSQIKDAETKNAAKEQLSVLYSRLGTELEVIGEYDQALAALNKAKDLLPGNYTIYADLSKLQTEMHDYRGAEKNIAKAVSINPASPDNWVAYVSLEKDHMGVSADDRLKQLEEAKAKTNQAPQVMNQYALVLEEQGKLKEAYAVLRDVVIANPGVQEYVQNLDRINIKIQQAEIKANGPR